MLNPQQLGELLESATTDLFRYETLPAYEVASDGSDYKRWLDGDDEPTWERKQPWLDTLRAWADAGKIRRRVRIIHDPITPYERYACDWGYALNAAAGEAIRVIDLAQQELPADLDGLVDFWLVDGQQVVLMDYADDGQFLGARVLDEGEDRYQAAAEWLWNAGTDFGPWWEAHPEFRRRAA